MARKKAEKPIYYFIDINTIHDQIMSCAESQMIILGYDINNPKDRKSITHNELNYILRRIYDNLFKPSGGLYNNQKSLLNYDDTELLQVVANTFLDLCSRFNKSLGLMSFSYMTGINYKTIYNTLNGGENVNPKRLQVFKSIQEGHKAAQVALLNDSPVGALAVANNDIETGLEWSKQQALTQANNTVYILSSERLQGLGLPKAGQQTIEPPQ